jgi:hypothetical protein
VFEWVEDWEDEEDDEDGMVVVFQPCSGGRKG